MSRTYKATGINLKSMPMGESDRLLTILTREFGLVRAVAMGSRKHHSSLGGRSGLFVVNELLIAKGRSLDKVTQAETLESYPGLSRDLKKLTASQYLAELSLCQALSEQPQEELFCLLNEHLKRLERSPTNQVLAHLTHAVFQLLILGGVAPQVHTCCVTRQMVLPEVNNADWRIGFSVPTGGIVDLGAFETLKATPKPKSKNTPVPGCSTVPPVVSGRPAIADNHHHNHHTVVETAVEYRLAAGSQAALYTYLTGAELALLQQLAQVELPTVIHPAGDAPENVSPPMPPPIMPYPPVSDYQPIVGVQTTRSPTVSDPPMPPTHATKVWQSVERILRHYAQYHFDRTIRSATLIDACFVSADHP